LTVVGLAAEARSMQMEQAAEYALEKQN